MMSVAAPGRRKFLAVALVGAANAGKSTLANRLSGRKLSITSSRPQSTRRVIHAVFNHGRTQVMLSDTPGMARNLRSGSGRGLSEAKTADYTLLVVDCSKPSSRLAAENIPHHSLVFNKCDKLKAEQVATKVRRLERPKGGRVFILSALSGEGVGELRRFLLSKAKEGEWLYPEGIFSNLTEVVRAEELTKEQLFAHLRLELPYEIMIETEEFKKQGGALRISQRLLSGKPSRKKIIIGKKGEMLKAIGRTARRNMEKSFARRVNLFLQVR